MIKKLFLRIIFSGLILACLVVSEAFAQTTEFTYQGRLTQSGSAATAMYDLQFRLFDDPIAGQGTQQGSTVTKPTVQAVSGVFTVQLDFGSAVFAAGADLYLEISVRQAGSMGGYTSLAPRPKITSTPYSVRSVNAGSADGLSIVCVGCVQDTHITSIDGGKVKGTVANATTAATATSADNVTGIVAVENGGTGSATQNFVDLTSEQTIDGNKTFNANVSANTFSGNGSGLTSVFPIQPSFGAVGTIAANSNLFVFAGSTATVSVNGNQRITGSANAALGVASGSATSVSIDLCYQSISGGNVISSINFLNIVVTANRAAFGVSNTITPPAGTYKVGFCIRNGSTTALNNNDWVQGWVMVTRN